MKPKRFYFEFRGPCVVNDAIVQPFRDCIAKGCANMQLKPARTLPDGEIIVEFEMLVEGLRQRAYEFVIRQNCEKSPGLVISDTIRRGDNSPKRIWVDGTLQHPPAPRITYDLIPVASAVDDGVCLEEFRSYLHIAVFRHLCRCKHAKKVLTRQLDDIDRLDTHYEQLKVAVDTNSDAIEELRAKIGLIEQQLQVSEERWQSRKKQRVRE